VAVNVSDDGSIEELAQWAGMAFTRAAFSCGDCRDYHSIRPYLRLAGVVRGTTRHGAQLTARLETLGRPGAHVLIAGAGDHTAFLQTARSLRGMLVRMTVVDRCDTPLALCREAAAREHIDVLTRAQDLKSLSDREGFDLIIAHRLLPFLAGDRGEVLDALRRALSPAGRLLLVTETQEGTPDVNLLEGVEERTIARVVGALTAYAIPLPEPFDEFRDRLRRYGQLFGARQRRLAPYDALAGELAVSGLVVERRELLSVRTHTLSGLSFRDEMLVVRRVS
jgi:hypothetical protein